MQRLAQENAQLRARLDSRGAGRGRTALAVVLVVLGSLLVVPAVIASWGRLTLTDTDRFVAAYAPLADDPAVQAYLADQITLAVDDGVGFDAMAQQVVDGVVGLGTGPRATAALQTLTTPLAAGLRGAVQSAATRLVASDAFAGVWQQALRTSHATLVATLGPDDDTVLNVDRDTLVLQLGPVVEAARTQLLAQGYTFAQAIPSTDRQVVLAQGQRVAQARTGYDAVLLLGAWLAPVSLLLLAAGVLASRRRSLGLLGAGAGVAVAAGVLLMVLAAGGSALPGAVPAVPRSVLTPVYASVTDSIVATAQALAVLGVTLAVLAWCLGPTRAAAGVRSGYGATVRGLRRLGVPRPGWPGWAWVLLRALVLLGAVAVLALVRPLSVGLVLGVALVTGVVVLVLESLAGPAEPNPAEAQPAT